MGQRLNGAVTLWVRRDTGIAMNGQHHRGRLPEIALVLTAEGVAPYSDGSSTLAFARANQAMRVVETYLLRSLGGRRPPPARPTGPRSAAACRAATSRSATTSCSLAGARPVPSKTTCSATMLGDVTRDAGGALATGSGAAGTFGSLAGAGAGGCVE